MAWHRAQLGPELCSLVLTSALTPKHRVGRAESHGCSVVSCLDGRVAATTQSPPRPGLGGGTTSALTHRAGVKQHRSRRL